MLCNSEIKLTMFKYLMLVTTIFCSVQGAQKVYEDTAEQREKDKKLVFEVSSAWNFTLLNVKKALNSGANPNVVDVQGISVLKKALLHDRFDCAALLIEAGATDQKFLNNILGYYCMHDRNGYNITKILALGANPKITFIDDTAPCQYLSKNRNIEGLHALLNAGGYFPDTQMQRLINKKLFVWAESSDKFDHEEAYNLFNQYADANAVDYDNGESALTKAYAVENFEHAGYIIRCGALNQLKHLSAALIGMVNRKGFHTCTEGLKKLLALGANPYQKDEKGKSFFSMVRSFGSHDCTQLLLSMYQPIEPLDCVVKSRARTLSEIS